MDEIIKAENLYFDYFNLKTPGNKRDKWILKDINFSINEGEFIIIAGANGSGKSTLLRLIDLLLLPTKGSMYIFGADTSLVKDPYELRSRIGFVFQNPGHQIITTTVLDELLFGPENLGIPKSEINKRIDHSIELTGIEELIARRTDELSGGQKQLVSIASVLTMDPQILLFDEPTSMLNPEYHDKIIKIIKNLNEKGKTIILVTHNSEDFLMGDRCFVIGRGSLIYDSDPIKLFENHEEIIKENGLEIPISIRVSGYIKKKFKEFPLCKSLEELSERIVMFRGKIE